MEHRIYYRYWRSLLVFLLLVIAVQLLGSLAFKPEMQQWYVGLYRPLWLPPDWVFPPGWTILYATVAVSGWMVWVTTPPYEAVFPLIVWGVQLALNCAWSWFFFYLQSPYLALVDIAFLWVFILLNIAIFWFHNRWAAILLVPYFSWVTYAGVLNAALYIYNR